MNAHHDASERESPLRLPLSHPSPRVRLEVAALDGEDEAQSARPPAADDEGRRLTVLIVAAEADLRRYVVECLRARTDLRAIEAATVSLARPIVAQHALALIIADERAREVISALPACQVILLVDDVPRDGAVEGERVRFLARPFTARELQSVVSQSIG